MEIARVYSQSLKKMKKFQGFQYTIDKIDKIETQIHKTAKLLDHNKKPVKNFVQARQAIIKHKHSKNKLEAEVDKIMEGLINQNKLQMQTKKISQRHSYKHYRVSTEPTDVKQNKKRVKIQSKPTENQEDSGDDKNEVKGGLSLPRIAKSASHSELKKPKSRTLKTQQQIVERLTKSNQSKLLQYIDINSVIRQYRAGLTSLKGIYYNPHNPYKKISQ